MSSPRLISDSSPSKLSIISLSSFDNQFISDHNNSNNNKNAKSFDQTIDQAVEYFEQILEQCGTHSNTSLLQTIDQQERKNDRKSKLELKKRDCEDFLRSLDKKQNFKIKQREQKLNCRQWCEEQNRRIANYHHPIDGNNRSYHSKNRNTYGSTFYCRKSLLQKPDGITYICMRKRVD